MVKVVCAPGPEVFVGGLVIRCATTSCPLISQNISFDSLIAQEKEALEFQHVVMFIGLTVT